MASSRDGAGTVGADPLSPDSLCQLMFGFRYRFKATSWTGTGTAR
jgi:hypothetical protein